MNPIDEAMFATIKEAAERIGVSQNFLRARVEEFAFIQSVHNYINGQE